VAVLLFTLNRNGLAMGQNYRVARRENRRPTLTPRSCHVTKLDLCRKTMPRQVLPSSELSDSVIESHYRSSLDATCLLRRFKHRMMVAEGSQGTTFRATGCHFGLTAQRSDIEDAEEGGFENRAMNGSLGR